MAREARLFKRMQVNMTEETFQAVKKIADDQRISDAEVLRKAIEAGLPHVPGYSESQNSPTSR